MKATTESAFSQDVLNSKKVVLLDVWAPWCGPCQRMMPIIEKISEEEDSWLDVVKLDASVEMGMAQKLGVSGLPTFLVFKDGKAVNAIVGMTTKDNLVKLASKAK